MGHWASIPDTMAVFGSAADPWMIFMAFLIVFLPKLGKLESSP
jgi:hypothetical protein